MPASAMRTLSTLSIAAAAIVRAHGGTVILDPAPAPEGGLGPDVLHARNPRLAFEDACRIA